MRRLIGIILVIWVGLPLRPIPAQISQPPLPVGDIAYHPRLMLTPDYLAILQPLQDDPAWLTLRNYVDSPQPEADFSTAPEQAVRALALAYHMTGQTGYADRAKVGLLRMVAEIEAVSSGTEVWPDNFLGRIAGVAVAYDWLYNALSPTDQQALARALLRAGQALEDPTRDSGRVYVPSDDGTYRFATYNHWGAQLIWALCSAGLALLGDEPQAAALLAYGQTLLDGWMSPALDDLSGGAWAEGPEGGHIAGWALAQTAAALWTTLGQNILNDSAWWYDRLAYNLFLDSAMPDQATLIGTSAPMPDAAQRGHAQNRLLMALFAGTDHAAWMRWALSREPDPLEGAWSAEALLWYQPTEALFPPPWRVWYTQRSGHVFLRSGWEDQAVTVNFNAGDRYASGQFHDQGSLTLARGDDGLLVHSGGGGYGGDFDANYSGRTIGGNTLLICDLAESFDGIRHNAEREIWLNDCGQRTIQPIHAINPFFRSATALYDTGTILRYGEEGSLHYFRADLTGAYNNTAYASPNNRAKVGEVLREFVFVQPGWVLLHDRLTLPESQFTPMQLFHSDVLPIQQGTAWSVTVGDSALYVQNLSADVGGALIEGYDVGGQPISPPDDASGRYRLQFTPTIPTTTPYFLTLLVAGPSGSSAPNARFVAGDGVYGAAYLDWQIMFDDDAGDLTSASFVTLPDARNVLITGLRPLGAYRVTLPNGIVETLYADDAGTLYFYMDSAGEVSLRVRP